MLIKGLTDHSKACVLIALKNLFNAYPYYGQVDWGEEFLVDYFLECGKDGFNSRDFYLIEESAPVMILPDGTYTANYDQSEGYLKFYDRANPVRYRLPGHRNLIYCYMTNGDNAHAICIPANVFVEYLNRTKYSNIILPKHGLIIDSRRYEQDFE